MTRKTSAAKYLARGMEAAFISLLAGASKPVSTVRGKAW
jgi:hypothetical protein